MNSFVAKNERQAQSQSKAKLPVISSHGVRSLIRIMTLRAAGISRQSSPPIFGRCISEREATSTAIPLSSSVAPT